MDKTATTPETEPEREPSALVSVIVPCFNKAAYVRETIESVLAQEDVDLEVVVVDDASTDGSWEVIQRYGDRVRAFRSPANRGSTATRNLGAARARGDYLMFLDADDVLAPGTLGALVAASQGRDDCVAACRWRKLRRGDDGWEAVPSGKPLEPPGGDSVTAWLAGWYFPPCAVLWPRPVYERSGGWDEMGPWDDADIMMRTLLQGTRIVVAPAGEAFYRIYAEPGASLSSLPTEAAVASRIRVLDKVGRMAEEQGLLPRYRRPLGMAYYQVATRFAGAYPARVLEAFAKADRHLGRRPLNGSLPHRILWRLLGLERKERLARWLADRGMIRRGRPTAAALP